jgi:hypothetical protein
MTKQTVILALSLLSDIEKKARQAHDLLSSSEGDYYVKRVIALLTPIIDGAEEGTGLLNLAHAEESPGAQKDHDYIPGTNKKSGAFAKDQPNERLHPRDRLLHPPNRTRGR